MNFRLRNYLVIILIVAIIFSVTGCSDDNGMSLDDTKDDNNSDDPIRNRPPETWLFASIVEASEFDKRIHFFWDGWDIDGVVVSYQWALSSIDTILEWSTIYRQDSIFVFVVDPVFPIDQYFYVRSIDDDGMMDPTPSSYLIPSE